jgi:hypothetical protein
MDSQVADDMLDSESARFDISVKDIKPVTSPLKKVKGENLMGDTVGTNVGNTAMDLTNEKQDGMDV